MHGGSGAARETRAVTLFAPFAGRPTSYLGCGEAVNSMSAGSPSHLLSLESALQTGRIRHGD